MFSQLRMLSKIPALLTTPKIVHIHSLDFHDCVFNQQWLLIVKALNNRLSSRVLATQHATALVSTNEAILNFIKKSAQSDQANKIVFMLGSACQSYIDDHRHRIKGLRNEQPISVFQGLGILHKASAKSIAPTHTKIELDPYLLADAFDNLSPGISFERALKANKSDSKGIQHANWVLDDTKMLIVYAQANKVASSLSPDTQIKYHFYDDKIKILGSLNRFYKNNTDLIPQNTTLILSQYLGEKPNVLHVIKGTGPTADTNYSRSIRKIVELCGYDNDFISITRLTNAFNSARVEAFKKWRNLSLDSKLQLVPKKYIHSFVVPSTRVTAPVTTFFKKPPIPIDVIKILSFDFDKCLYNELYLEKIKKSIKEFPDMTWNEFLEYQNEALCIANDELIKLVAIETSKIKEIKAVKLILGSARQSYQDDMINRLTGPVMTGSAHQALLMLRNRIEYELGLLNIDIMVEVNHLLLADIYAGLVHGSSYKLALAQMHKDSIIWRPRLASTIVISNVDGHATWVFDDSKLTIIYAHIHQTYVENKNVDVIYDFYDDRIDILENLRVFFDSNLKLIPAGSTLILNEYFGGKSKQFAILKGQGKIDYNYDASIKKMVELSGHELADYSKMINVLTGLSNENKMAMFVQWQHECSTLPQLRGAL